MGGLVRAGSRCCLSYWQISDCVPRSLTLFMLVSALMGLEVMQRAYAHAIASGYRFYSYGDSSLLIPERAL